MKRGMLLALAVLLCACVGTGAVRGAKAAEGDGTGGDAMRGERPAILRMAIGEVPVDVEWEENASVSALLELARGGLTIRMSMYGGFEQVGPIGAELPRDDMQTTTAAGDIVLYAGDRIVVFYGANSWAYTRLGRIADRSAREMEELLGRGDVTVSLWTE